MGALRLLLAICVVLGHGGVRGDLMSPLMAVQAFFLVSGFYMSLVLSTKYAAIDGLRVRYRAFLTARVLRLYPTYLVVLALAGCVALSGRTYAPAAWSTLNPVSAVLIALTNLGILGQEAVTYSGVDGGGGLYLARAFADEPSPAYAFLLVPQAWSISLELCFYALAPLLARLRPRWLIGLALASAAIRLAFIAAGLTYDPWNYRIFPAELCFFLVGMLAHRLSAQVDVPARFGPLALAATTCLVLLADRLPSLAVYAGVAVAVPVLFGWSRRSRVDGWIGDLSYPLYLGHILVISVLGGGPHLLPASLLLAVALLLVVERPVARLRARASRQTPVAVAWAGPPPVPSRASGP